ncbi:MAG: hypothetical protein CMH55_11030 [Myxococcales bacterium]|nr:hypothetical protein [Myxococcales bacterium]
MLPFATLLILAQGFELDLGGESPEAGERTAPVARSLGRREIAAMRVAFKARRHRDVLVLATEFLEGKTTAGDRSEAAWIAVRSALKEDLPRMAVILASTAIETGLGESRELALDELAPLLDQDATAMELAPILANQSLDDLPERWRGHSAYWVARHLLELEVVRREKADAPPRPGAKQAPAPPASGVVLDFGADDSPQPPAPEAAKEGEVTPSPERPKPRPQVEGEPPPDLNRARSLLGEVDRRHALFGRSRLLAGMIATAEGQDDAAGKFFRQAMVAGPRGVTDLATLELARVLYAKGEIPAALEQYRRVRPSSDDWGDALFEQAWAHFRMGNFGRTLGILEAFDSPFMIDERRDEIEVLRALSLYENCRYDDAIKAVDRVRRLRPAFDRLSEATAEERAAADWLSLYRRRDTLEDEILADRLRLLARNPGLRRTIEAYQSAEAEYARLVGMALDARAMDRIERIFRGQFGPMQTRIGHRVLNELTAQRVEIASLLKSAIAIRLEVEEQRTRVLQQQLRGARGGVVAEATGDPPSVKDDELYWPFTGEYWRDELDTYHVHLGRSCR